MSDPMAAILAAPAPAPQPGADPAPAPAPAAAAPAGGGDPVPEPAVSPDWMNGFPDDLRADPDLIRYKSVQDLAKGLKETRAWARGRVAIPAAEDDAGWQEFAQRMRPEKADDYKIDLPEGESPALADAYRSFAFEQGIPARWAQATAAFWNRQTTDTLAQLSEANQTELKSLELEYGSTAFARNVEATRNMLASAGVEVTDLAVALQHMTSEGGKKPGVDKAFRALFTLAGKYGELDKVDPTDVNMNLNAVTPKQAKEETARMVKDPALASKLSDPNSAERRRYERLMGIAKGA